MSTKELQGRLWSVAPHYWSRYFEPFFTPMYKNVLKQIAPGNDRLLLDAGCGSGLFSRLAIHAGAEVIGVDASPGLLEVARRRNPNNNFLEEDLESLPFADNSFDVVAGFNSFQFAGDFKNALTEARRVLKKGGKMVIGIWDKPDASDATGILQAIGTLLPPPPPGTPGPFALSEEGRMEEICAEIGLNMISKSWVDCPFLYYSLDDAVKSFLGTGPAAAAITYTSERVVYQTIASAMRNFHLSEDMYHMQNSFLVFVVEK